MGTLGSAKVPPYPGTVSGTIEEAIAEVDALIAQFRAPESPGAITDYWEIVAYLDVVEAQARDQQPSGHE